MHGYRRKNCERINQCCLEVQETQRITADKAAETYVYLCETDEKQLYYKNCRAGKYSSEVTQSNADRLFKLSEKLCGIEYQTREEEVT